MRKWCCGVHQMKVLASQGANCRHTWMLQLLHWPHGSIDFHCCTCYADHHAPPAAMAARLTTLQLLHWPRRSPCAVLRTSGGMFRAHVCFSFLTPVAPRVPCTSSARASPPLSPRIPSEPGAFHMRRTSSPLPASIVLSPRTLHTRRDASSIAPL